MSKISKSCLL